ncbi:MAG: dUTP diphosphatase [Leptospiraceae bacterium]|nr:dUTP diphosphatase [Leptospiraceae bacterium]
MSNLKLEILKIFPDALIPERKTQEAAGYDLFSYCPDGIKLQAMESILIPTGIKIAIPTGYDAEIRPRSGLSNKHLLIIPNSPGTIDSDYRGELMVGMLNLGKKEFFIEHKMRIAQILFRKTYIFSFEIVETLSSTERGEGGFGSTGH